MNKKVGRPKKPETLIKENAKLLKQLENLKAELRTADREQYDIIAEMNKELEEEIVNLKDIVKAHQQKEEDYQKILEENTSLRIMLGEDKKKDDLPDYASGVAVRNGKYLLTEMRFDVDTGQASVISSKEFCKNNEHYYAQYEFQKLLSKDDTIVPYKE